MQDVIKKCIDNLISKYPSDGSAILPDSPVIDGSNLISAISDMVSEFSQNRVDRMCNISPEIQTNLDKLVIIYEILDEYGYLLASKVEDIDNIEPCKREATIQLRMLYLRVLDEVIYLLEGGYSSAAFGRVRTIYEIGVFLEIISKNNEFIAKIFWITVIMQDYSM